jgi:hypothetical protein
MVVSVEAVDQDLEIFQTFRVAVEEIHESVEVELMDPVDRLRDSQHRLFATASTIWIWKNPANFARANAERIRTAELANRDKRASKDH